MKAVSRLLLLVVLSPTALPTSGLAQSQPPDLSNMSIEDLMKIEITSASRKEQRAADAAAAVFVITHDDIRRSGMTTIPDLLRLAPGVDVAQVSATRWAVSVRGFNGPTANKLLVLVDGRSVYNRLYSGVLWDTQDLMLDDIDRIEVVRGPGAALWGANAVNGVINILTKSAADTPGGLVRIDGGLAGEQVAVRYGGAVGTGAYRVYAQWTGQGQTLIAPGTRANDASHSTTTGFRADWNLRPDAFVLEGSFTAGQSRGLWLNTDPATAAEHPVADDPSDTHGGFALGRWTRTRAGGATLRVQTFVDIAGRQEPVADYTRRAFDVDTQYHSPVGTHHDLVAGAGYRFIDEEFEGHLGLSLTPPGDHASLVTAFVQDEIALVENRLAVTLGSQVQHDSASGAGLQPTARVMWKARSGQRLWAATSRALRTPSLLDRGIRVDLPPVPGDGGLPLVLTALGDPNARTEHLVDVEGGYRLQLGTKGSIDVTGFAGRYEHLQTQELSSPVVQLVPSPRISVTSQFGNLLAATTRGLEVVGHWTPIPAWRLDASYSAFRLTTDLASESRDPSAATEDGSAPRLQWQVRSSYSPTPRASLDVSIFHVGPLERFQVAGYTRADIIAAWRFGGGLSVMAIGQNLFDAAHAEFGGPRLLALTTQVPRSLNVRLAWRP